MFTITPTIITRTTITTARTTITPHTTSPPAAKLTSFSYFPPIESIHKHTASSVVWFMFGLLVGLFIMIAVLVYYRVKQVRQQRKDKPNKAAYFKQKNCVDGILEEKVILHPKELEALEMESQLGETV
jgi:heme/copper-type cytochrome/quinol oxidase subunit 2